jgi:hypothetical protein
MCTSVLMTNSLAGALVNPAAAPPVGGGKVARSAGEASY